MNNTRTDDTVFELITGCVLVIAALIMTALIVRVLARTIPLLERMVIPSVLAQAAPKTLVYVSLPAEGFR